METECNKIVRNSSIKIELDFSSQAGQAYVRFSNRTNIPFGFLMNRSLHTDRTIILEL